MNCLMKNKDTPLWSRDVFGKRSFVAARISSVEIGVDENLKGGTASSSKGVKKSLAKSGQDSWSAICRSCTILLGIEVKNSLKRAAISLGLVVVLSFDTILEIKEDLIFLLLIALLSNCHDFLRFVWFFNSSDS